MRSILGEMENSMIEEIRKDLFRMQDLGYKEFHSGLVPNLKPETIIGARTPNLRAYAKELAKRPTETKVFLESLPHTYYEENNLHSFLLCQCKDYEKCVAMVNEFLPYVDNWATCDGLSPKIFTKHRTELLEQIKKWLASEHTYTIRFGIEMLMSHFLDEDFSKEYPAMVAAVQSEEYYVNMMIAWYFATALAKQYEAVLPYITEQRLAVWTNNKSIQKAVESYRITPEQKEFLKQYKRKN